jgi:hypothetical protein
MQVVQFESQQQQSILLFFALFGQFFFSRASSY